MCHETTNQLDKATSRLISSRNFQRDGGRPTAFDMQVLIANRFVLLKGKLIGGERQLKAFRKTGKVSSKEMNENEPLMKHRYQLSSLIKTNVF